MCLNGWISKNSQYGKCSKILNTFLFLFSNKMLVFRAGFQKMLARIANREDPEFLRSSLIWVCSICLDLFGRQLLFKILEHLP